MKVRQRGLGVALLAAITALLPRAVAASSPPGPATAATPASSSAVSLSSQPVPEDGSWRDQVRDPSGPYVYPAAVYPSGPGVSDPNGILAGQPGGTTITAQGPNGPSIDVDLGIDTGGYVQVGIASATGTAVQLGYSEERATLSIYGDNQQGSLGQDDGPPGPGTRTDSIQSPAAGMQWTSPQRRGGERWIRIQLQNAGSVTLRYVRVRRLAYAPTAQDYTGHFLSSDAVLNQVWYDSAYTVDLDSFSFYNQPSAGFPVYVTDGAKRDRLVWVGDLAVDGLTGAYTTADAMGIVRDSLLLFTCQQESDGYIAMESQLNVTCPKGTGTPSEPRLSEYVPWFVVAAVDYYDETGDATTLLRLLPELERGMGYMASRAVADLFVTAPGEINWHPFDLASGVSSMTNVVWVRALRALAGAERQLGRTGQAAGYESQAARTSAALQARLWDARAGAYVVNAADPLPDHPQDANAQAALAGTLSAADARRALSYIAGHLESTYGPLTAETADDPYMSQYVSPYESGWEALARFETGDAAGALSLIRREYGHMAATDPASTMWEKMAPDGGPASYSPNQLGGGVLPGGGLGAGATSLSHGWSTLPVVALSGWVAGLRPTAPGWSSWTAAPEPADLSWAQAAVDTPQGPLVSRWRVGPDNSSFVLTAGCTGRAAPTAPASTGSVVIPLLGQPRVVAEDGQVIWDGHQALGAAAHEADGGLVVSGVTGVHTFAWSAS